MLARYTIELPDGEGLENTRTGIFENRKADKLNKTKKPS